MRFVANTDFVKRKAKHLRKHLRRYGHDLFHAQCLDLMARMYGFKHFRDLQQNEGCEPAGVLDERVDDVTLETRYLQQEQVMAEAGFGNIAGPILDAVNPTGEFLRSTIAAE